MRTVAGTMLLLLGLGGAAAAEELAAPMARVTADGVGEPIGTVTMRVSCGAAQVAP